MLNALYCLIGKSGTGKSTVMQALHDTFGYAIAQSYTDRPKRTQDEQGHIFLSSSEFDALGDLILPRNSQDGRYGMTEEILDKSDLIVLDYLGTEELLKTYTKRPVHVIGLHADMHARIVRIDGRGNTFQERRKRMAADEHDFYFMDDVCEIVVTNNDLFHVAHGRVYFSDVDEEELEVLFSEYGWSYYSLLGEDGWGVVAEAVFENSVAEYDTTEEYSTFEAAARALGEIIGHDISSYL